MRDTLTRAARACLPVLVGIAAAGCAGILGPDDRVPVDFRLVGFVDTDHTPEGHARFYGPPDLEAWGGAGEIVVEGDFLVPCANILPNASASRKHGSLVVRVDYRREKICQESTIRYVYEARVTRLAAGTYHLTVQNRLWKASQGGEGMLPVLSQEVVVR
jgi:hypothetical protein